MSPAADPDQPSRKVHPLLGSLLADRPFRNLSWESIEAYLPFGPDGEPRPEDVDAAVRELRAAAREFREAKDDFAGIAASMNEGAARSAYLASIREALSNDAVVPFADVLEAFGISRDKGERLREKGDLNPIVMEHTGNPRLYITVGAVRRFVRSRKLAPPPSKSSLSKAKREAKRKRGG